MVYKLLKSKEVRMKPMQLHGNGVPGAYALGALAMFAIAIAVVMYAASASFAYASSTSNSVSSTSTTTSSSTTSSTTVPYTEFVESGLPNGTQWSVSYGSVTSNTFAPNSITFNNIAAIEPFAISNSISYGNTYTPYPSNGMLNGLESSVIRVKFSEQLPHANFVSNSLLKYNLSQSEYSAIYQKIYNLMNEITASKKRPPNGLQDILAYTQNYSNGTQQNIVLALNNANPASSVLYMVKNSHKLSANAISISAPKVYAGILNPLWVSNGSNSGPNAFLDSIYVEPTNDISSNTNVKISIGSQLLKASQSFKKPVYTYMLINSSLSDQYVHKAEYVFSVNSLWIQSKDISPFQVTMYRYANSTWNPIETNLLYQKDGNYVYSAISPSFSTYLVSFSAVNSISDISDTQLTVNLTLTPGYNLYLCAGAVSTVFNSAPSWNVESEAPSGAATTKLNASVGYQSSNVCSLTEFNEAYYGMIVSGIGINASKYTAFAANASDSSSVSLTYTVTNSNSLVIVTAASGWYGGMTLAFTPSVSCKSTATYGTYTNTYVDVCQNQSAGTYTITASDGNLTSMALAAYVFPIGTVNLLDVPQSANMTISGVNYQNGASASIVGEQKVTANPPPTGNFTFHGWSTNNPSNIIIANSLNPTTSVGIQGNGTLTASWNGNSTFDESGLPTGAVWNMTYDGITENVIAPNAIVFSTAPGNFIFTTSNVTYNGITYIPTPSSGSLVAGNSTLISFSQKGVLTISAQYTTVPYNQSDIIRAIAPLSNETVDILIGSGTSKGTVVASGTGTASCNMYTCNSTKPYGVGSYNITAYLPSTGALSNSITVNVIKANPSLSLRVPRSFIYNGTGGKILFGISTYDSQLLGNLYVNNALSASTYKTGSFVTAPGVGTYNAVFNTTGNANYTATAITGNFEILPETSVVAYSSNGAYSSSTPLSITMKPGYPLYLCAVGVINHLKPGAPPSWTPSVTATGPLSRKPAASAGFQTSNTCTASTPAADPNMSLVGIGVNAKSYTAYTAAANSATADSLTYTVSKSGSFVVIIGASGVSPSSFNIPSNCSLVNSIEDPDEADSAYVAVCQNQTVGTYTASSTLTGTGTGAAVLAAYVFNPYTVKFDDNPQSGVVYFEGKDYPNGFSANQIGNGTISAQPPPHFVFSYWSVSNTVNLTIKNDLASPTNLTIIGNGTVTANYNGITTFGETGLPSGTTWNAIYDGMLNSSSSNTIAFDTIPGNYLFTVPNQTVSGIKYVPFPDNGYIIAGNITQIKFSPVNVCNINLSPNAIDFGTLNPATSIPTVNSVIDSNSGTALAYLFIYGTKWASTSSNFGVSNTSWSATSNTPFASASKLSGTAFNTSIEIPASGSNTINLGVSIPSGQPSGAYTQTITIENSC